VTLNGFDIRLAGIRLEDLGLQRTFDQMGTSEHQNHADEGSK
jgi:hypothetical protein